MSGGREFKRRGQARARKQSRGRAARRTRSATREPTPILQIVRQALARIPLAVKACALFAFANALCWSLVTPPFQAPDEQAHFAYVQLLAENNSLPQEHGERFSPEERIALSALDQRKVQLAPAVHTISTISQQRRLEEQLSGSPSRSGFGQAGSASSEPPLYYALETVPYGLGSGGTILERLQLMRLLSALMAALTAAFAVLFLREALPSAPWAWTVGGLGVALSPLLGFVSGIVNPDAMLFAVSAALFYLLARAFRRGLTQRSALVLGGAIALGLATKLSFLGLLPGALLGLVLLSSRQARTEGHSAYRRLLAPSLAIALSPAILYTLAHLLSGHATFGYVSESAAGVLSQSLASKLSFVWQLYLPRLPWMHNYFGELFTTRQLWFDGVVGLYGWVDTVFPDWVYTVALIPAAVICGLCGRELARHRGTLTSRAGELTVYAAMVFGLLLVVGLTGFSTATTFPVAFAEPRYLLPLLALWGAVLALAARGAGRRWGPVVGTLLVVLVFAHDVFSQLQVVARYYG